MRLSWVNSLKLQLQRELRGIDLKEVSQSTLDHLTAGRFYPINTINESQFTIDEYRLSVKLLIINGRYWNRTSDSYRVKVVLYL